MANCNPTLYEFATQNPNIPNQHFTRFGVDCQDADSLNLAFERLASLPDDDWPMEFGRAAKQRGASLKEFRLAYHAWQAARLEVEA